MEVVVKVKHARVDGAVGLNDGNVGELNVGRNLVFPDGFDDPVFDQHMTFVDDVGLTGHGNDTALEDVGSLVHVVVQPVAANHVLCHSVGRIVAPSGCWGFDFRDGAVERLDVRGVPPRIFSPVREGVNHVA